MSSDKPVILVTGGAGYIGAHTCKALAAGGYQPLVFDNLEHGHAKFVRWGDLIQGDIRNPGDIEAAFDAFRPAAVVHFAGYLNVAESVTKPDMYFENNVEGSENLIAAMEKFDCPAIVFSSTCAIYGIPDHIPIREDQTPAPITPYGESKLRVEEKLADRSRRGSLRYAALRYFNAAGADPEGEIWEAHDPEIHLIPLVLQAASGMRSSISIYGEDYPTEDGTCVRDYVHVTDLAEAHRLALGRLLDGNESLAVNLGTGRGYSVREVIEAARSVTGREIRVEIAPRRPGDPPRLIADPARAVELLGWRPVRSDLETLLRDAWKRIGTV
jgi:UDP-glucose-4-epimerase GalE